MATLKAVCRSQVKPGQKFYVSYKDPPGSYCMALDPATPYFHVPSGWGNMLPNVSFQTNRIGILPSDDQVWVEV